MNKKILILFALAILLMPGITKATNIDIRQVSLYWGSNTYNCPSLSSTNASSISFNGCLREQSSAYAWPYTTARFYLNAPSFDTADTYDVEFISFIQMNKGYVTTAKFNAYPCITNSTSGYYSWISCKNVKFVDNNTNYIQISFSNSGGTSTGFYAGLSRLNFVRSGESNTQAIIDYIDIMQSEQKKQNQAIIDNQDKNNQEQIDNANKNHQDTMDTITSTDTSGANDSANGFFNNFENNDHGLSGIVTAPLRLIQALTSRTLYQIPITMLDKTVYLPAFEVWLDSLDTNTKYALKTFRVTYNIIVGGLVSYGAVKGIFKKVEELKNPDDSRVEVMDL